MILILLPSFLDYKLLQKSSELSKLIKEVCENISQQVPISSFCADILEKKGIFKVVNNIRLLQEEELRKHCKEPYHWSKGLRPGDVIGVDVRVTSENDGLEVMYTLIYFMSILVCIKIINLFSNENENMYIFYHNCNLINSAGSRLIDRHGSPDETRRRASSLICELSIKTDNINGYTINIFIIT